MILDCPRGTAVASRDDMRWMWTILTISTSLATSGCLSAQVLGAGADDPRALALLPLTLPIDLGLLAAARASASDDGGPAMHAAAGTDPHDWVGDCAGPVLCADGSRHRCTGMPGDCRCDCVFFPADSCGLP